MGATSSAKVEATQSGSTRALAKPRQSHVIAKSRKDWEERAVAGFPFQRSAAVDLRVSHHSDPHSPWRGTRIRLVASERRYRTWRYAIRPLSCDDWSCLGRDGRDHCMAGRRCRWTSPSRGQHGPRHSGLFNRAPRADRTARSTPRRLTSGGFTPTAGSGFNRRTGPSFNVCPMKAFGRTSSRTAAASLGCGAAWSRASRRRRCL